MEQSSAILERSIGPIPMQKFETVQFLSNKSFKFRKEILVSTDSVHKHDCVKFTQHFATFRW